LKKPHLRKAVHAPHHEDAVLLRFAKTLAARHAVPPLAVEFGALDGVTNSATHLLVTQLGWVGLWIEPNPDTYRKLVRNVQARKYNVETLNIAIDTEAGPATFYPCRSTAAYSSLLPGTARTYKLARTARYGEPVTIMRKRLVDVLDGREAGVIVIDTEGRDTAIVEDMMQSGVRPCIVMVEGVSDQERARQAAALTPAYMMVWERPDHLNRIYVRTELLVERRKS